MKKVIESLIVAVVTIFGMGMVGCPLSTTLAALTAYVFFFYVVDKVIDHIKEKRIPTVLEGITYGCAFLVSFLGPAGIMYSKIYVVIVALALAVVVATCNYINKKRLN